MHELITAVLLGLRWLVYSVVALLIPMVVMVPVVAVVNALPVGPYTAAGLCGLGFLVAVALVRGLWNRYVRRSNGGKSGRHSLS